MIKRFIAQGLKFRLKFRLSRQAAQLSFNYKQIQIVCVLLFIMVATCGTLSAQSPAAAGAVDVRTTSEASVSSSGLVTMIDLGAKECIPCRMMAPILEELKKEYEGRADIVFIDVWKNPELAKKYRVQAIPTQIFLNADGVEVHRNVGFMDKKRIVEMLTGMGVG